MGIANVGNKPKKKPGDTYKDDYGTPLKLFVYWNDIFDFDADLAANANNAKCAKYVDKEQDFFTLRDLRGNFWLNPPYGEALKTWLPRVYELSRSPKCTIVTLLPASIETVWYRQWVSGKADKIEAVPYRVKFEGAKWSAPFPNVIAIYRNF